MPSKKNKLANKKVKVQNKKQKIEDSQLLISEDIGEQEEKNEIETAPPPE